MNISLRALFFTIFLCIVSLIFVAKILTFSFCCCLQVNPGATSSIYEGFWCFHCLPLALTQKAAQAARVDNVGRLGRILGAALERLGAILALQNCRGAVLGASWPVVGASGEPLAAS